MTPVHRRPPVVGTLVALLTLSACAAPAGSSRAPSSSSGSVPPTFPSVAAPTGTVSGTGTVIDASGGVELCLGAVMESYPPQCVGVPVDGWIWEGLDGRETSGEVSWGTYAVQGVYDGERFAVTDPPVMLALFDPMPAVDPTGGAPGTSDAHELEQIQEELIDVLGTDLLTSWTERGYVWVTVVWDDGTLQDAADAAYGEGVVVVTSALQPAG